MSFQIIWCAFAKRKKILDESEKLTITVSNLKSLAMQFHEQGVKEGRLLQKSETAPPNPKSNFGDFGDIFGGIFGGRK